MHKDDLKRLMKSSPKLVEYCIERILADSETSRILKAINREEKKNGRNNKDKSG